jgi:hypothetical protein
MTHPTDALFAVTHNSSQISLSLWFGLLGKRFMELITNVSSRPAGRKMTGEQFLTRILRELSTCLQQRNAGVECAIAQCCTCIVG